ncbi:MAG: tyrosine-type recombinase/integrase [Pseudomonadota bacterium]|mgnify:CR=1 FL=1
MAKHNAANTRIKREYFQYLREANRRDDASIDAVAKALSRFEESNGHKDFKTFHREQAVAFKRKLDDATAVRTGEKLARATVHSTLSALRAFFVWLAGQPGYKSKLHYGDADYFNLSDKDVRIAKAARAKTAPTLDQIHRLLSVMPRATDIEKRNRALIAFTILTGARHGALASLKMKHINLEQGCVDQDARDVRTKASKSFSTWFFPVGGDALSIFTDWCHHLRTALQWGDDDALFPPTKVGVGKSGGFAPVGLRREGWESAGPICAIFRTAFEAAGLPYFNPHSFRHTLVMHGERVCTSPEQFKAWSQNLGHGDVLTTFTSYGTVPAHRQGEVIRALGVNNSDDDNDDALAKTIAAALRKHGHNNREGGFAV